MQKLYYQAEIRRNREAIWELTTNYSMLEKYGREKFLLKRPNEDVYVIVREP